MDTSKSAGDAKGDSFDSIEQFIGSAYADKMIEVLQTVGERATEYKHPFLVRREGKLAVMILVTTDRGLCCAMNVPRW